MRPSSSHVVARIPSLVHAHLARPQATASRCRSGQTNALAQALRCRVLRRRGRPHRPLRRAHTRQSLQLVLRARRISLVAARRWSRVLSLHRMFPHDPTHLLARQSPPFASRDRCMNRRWRARTISLVATRRCTFRRGRTHRLAHPNPPFASRAPRCMNLAPAHLWRPIPSRRLTRPSLTREVTLRNLHSVRPAVTALVLGHRPPRARPSRRLRARPVRPLPNVPTRSRLLPCDPSRQRAPRFPPRRRQTSSARAQYRVRCPLPGHRSVQRRARHLRVPPPRRHPSRRPRPSRRRRSSRGRCPRVPCVPRSRSYRRRTRCLSRS